jgi:serine/threonine-protein kinase
MVSCLNCGRLDRAEASSPDERMMFLCQDCREEMKQRPQPIPGYEMVKLLGQGGMGSVILARQYSTGKFVAIKTLLPEVAVSEQSLKRFMREIEVAAQLQHPNIVSYIEHGTHKGVVYLVTEFVQGMDASKLAKSKGGRLPVNEVVQITAQTLDALAFAHQRGFVHRDIKEQNILVNGTYPQYISKLTDFGLAKSFKQTGMSGVTMAGDVAGTVVYMPPEQIRDFRNVQPISDVYAVGMMAYSLMTGGLALELSPQAGIAETVKAIFEKPIVPMARRLPDVPPKIAMVIERALEKDLGQRWGSASVMLNALLQSM